LSEPLFGRPIPRVEDHRLLTSGGTYVSDLDLPEVASVTYVTSTAAHARIVAVDTDRARKADGVLGVYTVADVDLGDYPVADQSVPSGMRRSLLARDVARFVGEPIVAIVAESPTAATDAAEQVDIELEMLDPVVDVEAALTDQVLLFPEAGTNIVRHAAGGDDDVDLGNCEVVVKVAIRSSRVAPCPMETRAGAACWDPDGRLTHWSSCQGVHSIRTLLSGVYGLAPELVRVIAPDVGGSFGAKARPYPEEVLLPWLAARLGRPVRWVPDRSQDMVGLGHSRAQLQYVELGGRLDGTFEGLQVRLLADCGAYPLSAPLLAQNTGRLVPGVYRIPKVGWRMDAVVTSTTPITAYRGAGRPEAAALLERAVDVFASRVGLDPVTVRFRNLLRPEDFPYRTPTDLLYDSGSYQQCLDLALDVAGYDQLRSEQVERRRRSDPVQIGIGVATFVDRTAGIEGTEYGAVQLRDDGSLLVTTGSCPYGQGHHTSWAMLVSDRTGIPLERIEVRHGDTDVVPRGAVTGGSRSAQRAGWAVAAASDALVTRAKEAAAHLLEAAVEDIVIDLDGGGRFYVTGTPSLALTWRELAGHTLDDPLRCETDVGGPATYPFGAYVAVVEVDTETGGARLRRLVTVDDAGRIINPLLAHGQVHGGAAQGVGQALFEEFVYDGDGNPVTTSLAEYAFPSAAELPSFESRLVETPSPNNPLGVKGIAESGTIGAPPAVQNAVVDALRPFGVEHIDMPCTPRRIWEALEAGRGHGQAD
jgi:aerobic carbon-monoxide dehydrogenase large subunit